MNPDSSNLRHQQEHEQEQNLEHDLALNQAQAQAVREFVTAEELIRYDAQQTHPPPAIAERLNGSIRQEPKPTRPWWQRLFSRG